MGNKVTRHRSDDDRSFVDVDLTSCEPNVKFSPKNSRALCIGVGRSLHIERQSHDLPARDRDARIVYEALRDNVRIPSAGLRLLASDSAYTATKANVRYGLLEAARNVRHEGVLIVFFSGHATRCNKTLGLAGSDYLGDADQLVTSDDFLAALRQLESRDRRVIVILDCCLAVALADEISVKIDPEYRVQVVAACSTAEKSLCTNELGSGAFPYFLGKYLRGVSSSDTLNMTELIDYCVPLCRALVDLVLHDSKHFEFVDAQVFSSSQLTCVEIEGGFGARLADATETDSRGGVDYTECLKYLNFQGKSEYDVDVTWQNKLTVWLNRTVEARLTTLREFLVEENVYQTARGLVMRSAGLLSGRHAPQLAEKLNIFLLSAFRVLEVLVHVTRETQVRICCADLKYYMLGVAEALEKEIGDLVRLQDFGKRLKRGEEDETDMKRKIDDATFGRIPKYIETF